METRNRSKRKLSNPRQASSPALVDSVGSRTGTFHVLAALSIAVLCLAVYSNSLSGPFVFDDRQNVQGNQSLHWTSLSWSGVQRAVRESPSSSRPVANVSFALNYYFGQDNVWGYHTVNVGIHLLTALLVYLLALATLGRVPPREDRPLPPSVAHWIALTAALIFASHPIQTQAVTYIVQRMTSLCGFFYLAALLLYIHGRTAEASRRRWALWAGGVVCWVLALGSKQIAATLPLTILFYEWYFFQDLSTQWVKKNAKFGLLAAVLLGLVGWAYLGNEPLDRVLAGYATRDFTLGERLLTQPRVVMFYLSLLVFPHPAQLNLAHHVVTSQSLVEPITTLLSMAGVCGLLCLAIYLARRHRIASFCLLWFFLHLVIESSVIPLEMVFEHRLYLPMFGFSLLVAWLLYALAGARSQWAIGVAAAICLLLAGGTYQRNRVWQNELTLWEDAVAKSPLYERPHNNLGIALQALGRTDEAMTHYQEALRINPNYATAHYNWGLVLPGLGRFEEAVAHNQEALRIKPDHAGAHNNLAWLRATCPDATIRDGQRALEHAMRAVQLGGDGDAMILDTLSAAYAESGNFDEAVRWQEQAVRMAGDKMKDVLAARLELYKQGRPYRDSN